LQDLEIAMKIKTGLSGLFEFSSSKKFRSLSGFQFFQRKHQFSAVNPLKLSKLLEIA